MPTNPVLESGPRAFGKAGAAGSAPAVDAKPRGFFETPAAFSGGFAHEFNNLLTVILGHTEFLLKRRATPEMFLLRVEEIEKAAKRGLLLADRLLGQIGNQIAKRNRRP